MQEVIAVASVEDQMPEPTTSIGVDSPNSEEAVSLICHNGHVIGWPKSLFPRPDRCLVIMDVKSTVKEYCNSVVYKGLKLVPDDDKP